MAGTVWKGFVSFGLVSFPVRLQVAARDKPLRFHMLHKKNLSPIKEVFYCRAENKPLQREDLVKGFEVSKDRYVVVDPKELEKIAPKTAQVMGILQFVKDRDLDPGFGLAHGDLGHVYCQKGMYTEAIPELQKSVELEQIQIQQVWLAEAYALSGQKEQARRLRARLEERAPRNEIDLPAMALLDIALGEADRAVARLKTASANYNLEPMSAVPSYDPLRALRFAKFFPAVETQSTTP